MNVVTSVEQDTIYQYVDGRALLNATIQERGQVLRKLEQLTKLSQKPHTPGKVVQFPLARAQTLLFELSVINECIDTLILEINCYADRCGKPRIEVIETKLQ